MKNKPLYYDMDGKPMELMEWARSFEYSNRRIASTFIPGVAWISTVWLGLDHSFLKGTPLIFESMAFKWQGRHELFLGRMHYFHEELACHRYSTRVEAMVGHQMMVERFLYPRNQLQSGLYLLSDGSEE